MCEVDFVMQLLVFFLLGRLHWVFFFASLVDTVIVLQFLNFNFMARRLETRMCLSFSF